MEMVIKICLPRNTFFLTRDLPIYQNILKEYWSNPFFGWGDFFVTAEGLQTGPVFGTFIFLVIIIIIIAISLSWFKHHDAQNQSDNIINNQKFWGPLN